MPSARSYIVLALSLACLLGPATTPAKPPLKASRPAAYYRASGRTLPLYDHPTYVAYRTAEGARETAAELEGAHLIARHRAHRTALYRLSADHIRATLKGVADGKAVEAGLTPLPCYRLRGGQAVVPTDEIIVKFHAPVSRNDAEAFAALHRATVLRGRKNHPDHFVLRVADPADSIPAAYAWGESDLVVWAQPNWLKEPKPKFLPNDTLFGDQWDLHNTGQSGGMINRDPNAERAWDITRGDSNVVIGVLDNGFDLTHPDLAANLFTNTAEGGTPGVDGDGNGYTNDHSGWDFDDNDNDPSPGVGDDHGTAVLGPMIAVTDNGTGVAGLANRCTFLPVRVYSGIPPVQTEADAIEYAASFSDVITISYVIGTDDVVLEALRYAVTHGRNGLGTVVCAAMGNDGVARRYTDDAATAPEPLTVSGSSNYDRRSVYADFGPSLNVVAAAGGGNLDQATTDRQGSDGYSNGDYDDTWGGTSASAPIAAAVAALIVAEHPAWTGLEVRQMLEASCDRTDWQAYPYNDAGWNEQYGFGRVNTFAALTMDQPAWDPYEPDDSADDAATISDGELQYRSLDTASDADWACFAITNLTDIRLSSIATTNVTVQLYDASTGLVAQANPDPYAVLVRTNLSPGTYYARVMTTSGVAVAQYGLHLALLNMVDGYETNDSLGTAKTIAPRTLQRHTFYPAGDEDWATFTLASNAYVEIWTAGEFFGDTTLSLRDSVGTEIANNDDIDWPELVYSHIATSLVAGTYYIQVSEFDDVALTSYQLFLEVHLPDAHEWDDSADTATTISSGEHLTYSLYPAGNDDWLRFDLTNEASVLIRTDTDNPWRATPSVSGGGDTKITLYDQATNQLAQNDDGNAHYFSAIYQTGLPSGTYYIQVEGVPGFTSIETNPNHFVSLDVFNRETVITHIMRDADGMHVYWPGDASYTYRVRYLSNGAWETATNLEGRVGPNTWLDDGSAIGDPFAQTMRWYRVTTP